MGNLPVMDETNSSTLPIEPLRPAQGAAPWWTAPTRPEPGPQLSATTVLDPYQVPWQTGDPQTQPGDAAGGPPSAPQAPAGGGGGRRRGITGLVALALAAGLFGGAGGAAATYAITQHDARPTTVSSLSAPPVTAAASKNLGPVSQVAAAVLPSVVSITVLTGQGGDTGSGVILSANGDIVTNNHVIAAANGSGGTIWVTFSNGKRVQAKVLGADPVTDIAVIQAAGVSGLKPAALGNSSSLVVGQQVVAIGSPLGLSGTVTNGIVSALNRPVSTGGQGGRTNQSTVIDAIQTDAPINPGNSGGPLVNMSGQVVGINSAIATLGSSFGGQSGSIGLGFAIPIDQVRPIAQQLITRGVATHALIGVSVTDATQQGLPFGAAVRAVSPGSAAAAAGLQPGDVITSINGQAVDSADALVAQIRAQRPGDMVRITWLRGVGSNGSGGTSMSATVTLGSDRASSGG